MTNIKKRLLIVALLLLAPNFICAYCPPVAQIDSIENGKECLSIKATSSCGGEVKIVNHCQEEFYFYDRNGNVDESFVLVNNEEWNENFHKYQNLEKETGKNYSGRDIISVGVGAGTQYLDLKKGYWTIKVFSKEDNRDIVVKGGFAENTGSTNFDRLLFVTPAILWLLFLILYLLRKIFGKRVFTKDKNK